MQTLEVSKDARGVARVTLARPEKHNAMSGEMIAELSALAGDLAGDTSVRVVVLTGQGRSFCAGGDLGWMKAQIDADGPTRASEARKLAMMLRAWDHLPKPVIGRVQGNALGGGVGLASVCDVAIGVEGAKMGLTEVRLGLIPATIGPYVVARMGAAKAREVFASGRVFSTQEALRLNLLSRVVMPEALDEAIEAEVAPYLVAAPGAVGAAKCLIHKLAPSATDAQIEASIAALVAQWDGTEAPHGITSFFAKTPPDWAQS